MRRARARARRASSLLAPPSAAAHPLGNFTVNRFAAVDVSGDRALRPLRPRPRRDPDVPGREDRVRAARLRPQLKPARGLEPAGTAPACCARGISSRPGAGGLPTLRFEVVFAGRPGRVGVDLRRPDVCGPDRLEGDRRPRDARRERDPSSVPAASLEPSSAHYPRDRLRAPLDGHPRRRRRRAGQRARHAAAARSWRSDPHRQAAFEGLVSHELTLGFVLLSLVARAVLGRGARARAGHGKAIVAGYLVGTRGGRATRSRSARS